MPNTTVNTALVSGVLAGAGTYAVPGLMGKGSKGKGKIALNTGVTMSIASVATEVNPLLAPFAMGGGDQTKFDLAVATSDGAIFSGLSAAMGQRAPGKAFINFLYGAGVGFASRKYVAAKVADYVPGMTPSDAPGSRIVVFNGPDYTRSPGFAGP